MSSTKCQTIETDAGRQRPSWSYQWAVAFLVPLDPSATQNDPALLPRSRASVLGYGAEVLGLGVSDYRMAIQKQARHSAGSGIGAKISRLLQAIKVRENLR